ncbi:MAG: L-serine ammonia-lyase, iron-sulfur-dependent, subunit alpha [Elusimicrobia bacterium]|nr:L-serine ammonia-lyase, iron-sulfur-dependent, subunit alpha [Elusimicrobiota bacterium]
MKNLISEVLKHEVYPAMGCTEPVAVAFAAATAASLLKGRVTAVAIKTDPGTYKNGLAVAIPNTRGEKGNLLAAAIGAVVRRPELGAELFKGLPRARLKEAAALLAAGRARMEADYARRGIFISVEVRAGRSRALCVLEGSHKQVALLKLNGKTVLKAGAAGRKGRLPYKELLRKATFRDLFRAAEKVSPAELVYIKKGVEMNLAAAREGLKLKKVGYYIEDLIKKGYLKRDILSDAKLTTAAATDARMAGAPVPVMSSGESGNQGVVAVLVPWLVGKAFRVPERRILKSIALSHLVNSYIKVFTGELAPICGCAVAAGVGASVAVVWQRGGADVKKTALAVNTVISDIGGMLCDGAKSGCALKVATSADSAIRAAWMASNGEGITDLEGFVGATAEETIKNIARISSLGMDKVDRIILDIMSLKSRGRRK